MPTVLDLDLDFFVWPIAHWPEGDERLPESEYSVSRPDDVREFLEQHCCLHPSRKIPGRAVIEHRDAFFTWRAWLRSGILPVPFDVIHVDAHADLGLGDAGWVYLLSEVLALPLRERDVPEIGPRALNSGNYLAFAIANRWIGRLTYVFPVRERREEGPAAVGEIRVLEGGKPIRTTEIRAARPRSGEPRPSDLMPVLFRGRDTKTGIIELACYGPEAVRRVGDATLELPEPLRVEPPVPFNYVLGDKFKFAGFTHMTVAQSPQFTPASADRLLPIFRDYFVET